MLQTNQLCEKNAVKVYRERKLFPYDSVLGFNTDDATNTDTLKSIFPKMIHIICVLHGLHNVADAVTKRVPLADSFILNAKNLPQVT